MSSALNMVAVSTIINTVVMYKLPDWNTCCNSTRTRTEHIYLEWLFTLGEAEVFNFATDVWSGGLAFMKSNLLLLADGGLGTVHVIDPVSRKHMGYITEPGQITQARRVATWGTLVAVSCGCGSTRLFQCMTEGGGGGWVALRHLRNYFIMNPTGLRFSADGTELAVLSFSEQCGIAGLFRVDDGAYKRHLAVFLKSYFDVEEHDSGWILINGRNAKFINVHSPIKREEDLDLGLDAGNWGIASAIVPAFGLIILGNNGCLQVVASRDIIAMNSMSVMRTTWMAAVCRGPL